MSDQHKPQLCQRCNNLRHIKREFKLCDHCELEVLRVWQSMLECSQEVARVA